MKPDPAARMRLFTFPYAGGGAGIYRPWSDLLPSWIDVCAVQPPGREGRFGTAPITDMPTLIQGVTAALLPLLDRPFAFFGHSLGSLLAYETALAIARKGAPAPLLLIVSGHVAPQLPPLRPPVYALPDDVLLREIARLNGTSTEVLQNPEILELFLPLLRADFQLADTYIAPAGEQLTCPIMALGSDDDDYLNAASLAAWGELTCGSFETHMFEGDHFYINSRRAALIAHITPALVQRFAACQSGPSASLT